jgi:hypothetical protein
LKLDLSKIIGERVYEFNGAKLTIRPYPRGLTKNFFEIGSQGKEAFRYCLVRWEGIMGSDDKPLPLTDAVKDTLFDSHLAGIADFVMAKNMEMIEVMRAEGKN